jgi:sigma-B regulation protein RsbU (phosphoserine phosphatase)
VTSAALQQARLFANLPADEVQRLAGRLRTVRAESGALLMREGEPGDHFYVVVAGEIEVIKSLGSEAERRIAVQGAGDFLGELGLLNRDGRRTASIRARTPVELLELSRADFDALLHSFPMLAYEMVRVLGERLTESHNAAMRDLLDKHFRLQAAYQALEAAQAEVIEKEKLDHELQLAYEIQLGLLPSQLPQAPGYSFGARMLPARAVGGDFYDFIPLPDGRLGLVIGDVANKGVPAALFMAQTHALLRAEACRALTPGAALRGVDRHLGQMNQAGLFVTALYAMLEPKTGRLSYARAGHERPLLRDEAGRLRPIPGERGQVLGVLENVTLDEQEVILEPGTTLLLYTDGVTDALDANGTAFGLERLAAALCSPPACDAQGLCDQLVRSLLAYQGSAPQYDDISVLAVQRL